jgi:hypothetical protein
VNGGRGIRGHPYDFDTSTLITLMNLILSIHPYDPYNPAKPCNHNNPTILAYNSIFTLLKGTGIEVGASVFHIVNEMLVNFTAQFNIEKYKNK